MINSYLKWCCLSFFILKRKTKTLPWWLKMFATDFTVWGFSVIITAGFCKQEKENWQAIWLPKRVPLCISSLYTSAPAVCTSRAAMQQAFLWRRSLALTVTSQPLQNLGHGFQGRCPESQLAGLIGIYPQRVISHFQGARVSFPVTKMK